jgi:hypothetical protein
MSVSEPQPTMEFRFPATELAPQDHVPENIAAFRAANIIMAKLLESGVSPSSPQFTEWNQRADDYLAGKLNPDDVLKYNVA